MDQGKILAIDDEPNIRHLIQNEFSLEGFKVTTAGSGEEGLKLFEDQPFDVVLLDIRLPRMNGIEVLRRLKKKDPGPEVIMITAYGDIQTAVDSLKLGARDYLTKPFKLDELLSIVKKAVQDLREKSLSKPEGTGERPAESLPIVICPSPAMKKVYDLISRVAKTNHTVLLQGETGVGKDVLAYRIHQQSLRQDGPFVTVDCGLLSHNLAESELYGHRKGAFSGATEAKLGLVEKSHTGTLFLDEIGNIDMELQKKFLRFLETRSFRRIGEVKEQTIDTRIILATNLDLQEAIRKGDLRSDLFYRMTEFVIPIPPLRERPEDIPLLTQFFLSPYVKDGRKMDISKEALAVLTDYPWPGNIRELKAVIGKAALLADSSIRTEDFPAQVRARHYQSSHQPKTLEDMEKEHIMNVLAETEGNQTRASEVLGINRKTLYKKIKTYKIFS
ncbi:MAG: sigma-54-dependent Fis family transcriptional regulator [Deltaproteobacteria bacterium]|nr:sigma-54-dependent Fis family transcriptional regulator [Deltaproteobacteria bacterium]